MTDTNCLTEFVPQNKRFPRWNPHALVSQHCWGGKTQVEVIDGQSYPNCRYLFAENGNFAVMLDPPKMLPSWEAAAQLYGSNVTFLFMAAWIFGLINLSILPILIYASKREDAELSPNSRKYLPGQWIVCPMWLCGCYKGYDDIEHMAKPAEVEISWQKK